jgi:hypothetical protein
VPAVSVAKTTGIDDDTVTVALGRLLVEGLVETTPSGWWVVAQQRGAQQTAAPGSDRLGEFR